MLEEYPSNSHKSKEETGSEETKNEIVTVPEGSVTVKKRSLADKIFKSLVPGDIQDVRKYIINEVVIPAFKKAISQGVDILLYRNANEKDSKRNSVTEGVTYVSYNDFSKKDRFSKSSSSKPTGMYSYRSVCFDSRGQAEYVIEKMKEIVEAYDMVSVEDLYDVLRNEFKINIDSDHTDDYYGWTNLRTADCVRSNDGWKLKLPPVMPLEK